MTSTEQLQHDIEAYRGALGYSVRGHHNGRLTNGEIPKCGLCEAKATPDRNSEARLVMEEVLGALVELRDLMVDVRNDEYKPDSFTCQPANTAITKLTAILGKEVV